MPCTFSGNSYHNERGTSGGTPSDQLVRSGDVTKQTRAAKIAHELSVSTRNVKAIDKVDVRIVNQVPVHEVGMLPWNGGVRERADVIFQVDLCLIFPDGAVKKSNCLIWRTNYKRQSDTKTEADENQHNYFDDSKIVI